MNAKRGEREDNGSSSGVGRVTPVRLAAVLKLPFPVDRFELFCQPGVDAPACVRDLLCPDKVLLPDDRSWRQEVAFRAQRRGGKEDAPVSARQATPMVDPRQT